MMLSNAMVVLVLIGQAESVPARARDAGAERLEFMKRSVETYRFAPGFDGSESPRLQAEPVFRLGKQGADDLEEGAIFLWVGAEGRPEAAVQVFLIKNERLPRGLWLHEFTSLSPGPLVVERNGTRYWFPTTPGVTFQAVPGAPRPAETPPQRLRQMRSLASGFRASDDFKRKGKSDLRLLPTPVARYGKRGTRLTDGALFAFVLGTDPEVFLFLEARPGKDGPEWQYAFAPMTVYAVKASYQGKAVWELPDREPSYDPSKPFFDKEYVP